MEKNGKPFRIKLKIIFHKTNKGVGGATKTGIKIAENIYQKSKISMLMQRENLYQFQVAHSQLDLLIKVLFRLYGGQLYTSYIAIDEADIARALKINLKKVKEQLHLLHEYQVIDYRKINLKPQVEFLKGRLYE